MACGINRYPKRICEEECFKAELKAMEARLILSWDNEVRDLVVEDDCAQVTGMIWDRHIEADQDMHELLMNIQRLLSRSRRILMSSVHREVNVFVDCVAKRGIPMSNQRGVLGDGEAKFPRAFEGV
ncbi:hypothetical protein RJT34_03981 [Clitoria ternatea]|uniref:RNase H type-1 domain-containing protein n=1 Tax=Clitoria ternatea TaxID=43366 RepID=A0AAN9Q278_CLITE